MAGGFASGKRALGVCDVCGFTYKLKELKRLVEQGRDVNLRVCGECWDPDHPQDHIGEVRINDPQALRNPRPDSGQYAQSRAVHVIADPVFVAVRVGGVTTSIT